MLSAVTVVQAVAKANTSVHVMRHTLVINFVDINNGLCIAKVGILNQKHL